MLRLFCRNHLTTHRVLLKEYVDPSKIRYTPPAQPEQISISCDALGLDVASVYGVINEIHRDALLSSKQDFRLAALDNVELRTLAIFKAKQASSTGYIFPILKFHTMPSEKSNATELNKYAAFIERLKLDGGPKIIESKQSILHFAPDNFNKIIEDLKGLSLDEALLAMKWHQSLACDLFTAILNEAIMEAKEGGLNLQHSYIADISTNESIDGFSAKFIANYVRGAGRYGVTGTPTGCSVKLVVQERTREFESRVNDPLEWMRTQLRATQRTCTDTANQIYMSKRNSRPIKRVHC